MRPVHRNEARQPGTAVSSNRGGGEDAPLLAVCANQAWNLVNFRAGLIRDLLDAGYRVIAIAPPDPSMEEQLARMGCQFAPVPFDAMGLSPRTDLGTFMSLLRVLRAHRPSAWLSWTIKPNIYGSIAASLLQIPAFPNVSGLGTVFIRQSPLTSFVRLLYRMAFKRAPTVFFQNKEDLALFSGGKMIRRGQGHVIPGSGLDLQRFSHGTDERPPQRHFLMIARIVADKGVREYVEAAQAIKARWPDSHFRLMGPVSVENRTAISMQEVQHWEDRGWIEHVPHSEDVRPALAAADFVVLPSYREGLSRVLLEAAAMGRPIVTTDVPGCRDVVRDGENGFLCEARNAPSLTEALGRAALTGDEDWRRMGQAGRARIEAEFSQERVSLAYLNALAREGLASSPTHSVHNQ